MPWEVGRGLGRHAGTFGERSHCTSVNQSTQGSLLSLLKELAVLPKRENAPQIPKMVAKLWAFTKEGTALCGPLNGVAGREVAAGWCFLGGLVVSWDTQAQEEGSGTRD